MSKHFNAGNVWGKILELKKESTQGGTDFLMISLDCGGKHGSVRAYGRIFGKDKIEGLVAHHKENPGTVVHFRGYIGQYEKGEDILTNFTFYAWQPDLLQAPRAAFVLVGEVKELDQIGDMWRITMHLSRKGQPGHGDLEEDFTLWSFDGSVFAGMMKGQIVELKGYMQQGEGVDDFGTATGDVRPIVHRSRIVLGF